MRLRDIPGLLAKADKTIEGLAALAVKYKGKLPIRKKKKKSIYSR